MIMVELMGGKADHTYPDDFKYLFPLSTFFLSLLLLSHASLSGLKHSFFNLGICLRGDRAVCHDVFLATLAGLHDHV